MNNSTQFGVRRAPIRRSLAGDKVYFMKNRRNGYTKIGVSCNPKFREKTLQSEEPEIELLFAIAIEDAYRWEWEFHDVYSAKRIRGEWFALDDEEIAHCKGIIESETDQPQ